MKQVVQTPEQLRFLVKLLGFDFCIEYNPGRSNMVVDALSRQMDTDNAGTVSTLLMHSLSLPTTSFLEEIKTETLLDPELKRLIQSRIAQPENFLEYMYRDGNLFKGGKIMLSSDSKLKALILFEFHSTPIRKDGGIHKTWLRISTHYYWSNLKQDVQEFVRT